MSYAQQRLTALMLDEDADFCSLVKRILRTLEVEVVTADSKIDFLVKLKQMRPGLCIVDLNMAKNAESYSVIQDIRKASIAVPLFIVSVDPRLEAVTSALHVGATDYFVKPIDREVLEKKLSYHLKDLVSANTNRPYFSITGSPYSVQLEFSEQLESIDEFGITFHSVHQIPKGTLVKVSGKIIEEITQQEKIVTSVMSNNFDPASQLHIYYAEFEDASKACLSNIRKWLMLKTNKPAARPSP